MDYLPLSDNAARQVIDSTTVFDEFGRVQAQARQYAGGMYWKRQQGYQYLVKTTPDNRQHRIGPRSPETERIFEEFSAHKYQVEARLKSLKAALTDAERMNKALKTAACRLWSFRCSNPSRASGLANTSPWDPCVIRLRNRRGRAHRPRRPGHSGR